MVKHSISHTHVQGFRILIHSFVQPTSLESGISLFLQPLHVFHAFPQLLRGFVSGIQPQRRLTVLQRLWEFSAQKQDKPPQCQRVWRIWIQSEKIAEKIENVRKDER